MEVLYPNTCDFSMRRLISQDPCSGFRAPSCTQARGTLASCQTFSARGVKCKQELGTGINLTKSGIHLIFIFVMPIIYASCIAMVFEHCFVNKS